MLHIAGNIAKKPPPYLLCEISSVGTSELMGHTVAQLVEALRCKLIGQGFVSLMV